MPKTVKLLSLNYGEQRAVTVPAPIARQLVANGIERFRLEVTEEGLLYRPVFGDEPVDTDDTLPEWLQTQTPAEAVA